MQGSPVSERNDFPPKLYNKIYTTAEGEILIISWKPKNFWLADHQE